MQMKYCNRKLSLTYNDIVMSKTTIYYLFLVVMYMLLG